MKFSNGELHRYTVEQMADKFGVDASVHGGVTKHMPVTHKITGSEGLVLASFKATDHMDEFAEFMQRMETSTSVTPPSLPSSTEYRSTKVAIDKSASDTDHQLTTISSATTPTMWDT